MTKTVRGISAEDFAAWKYHPVTKLVRSYLSDYADALAKTALEEFLGGGSFSEPRQLELRGRLLVAKEAAELEFDAVAMFYQEEPENAAKGSKD